MPMPPLTAEQARTVADNAGLVGFVLHRLNVPQQDWDDAYQDGLIGLMRAVQKFDPSLGYALSTYSMAWIRQAVGRGRAIFEGTSFRQAERGTIASYEPPVSLDLEVAEGITLAGVVVDAEPTPDTRALDTMEVHETIACARSLCHDAIDLAILDALIAHGAADGVWTHTDTSVARRCGRSMECIRRRRIRLQHDLRQTVEAA